MSSYCAVSGCAAALFSSDHTGGSEAQKCRQLEKAVVLHPLPSPVKVCLHSITPFTPSPISLYFFCYSTQDSYACLNQWGRGENLTEKNLPWCGPRWHNELELMEGGEACRFMVCNGQWFQFPVSKENMSSCVCVLGDVGWSGESCKHTSGCMVWAKDTGQPELSDWSFQKHNNRNWNTWIRIKLRQLWNRARWFRCNACVIHVLPPEVCPPLSAPKMTPSLPPRPQAYWGCTCWKCRSGACVFAVSEINK